MSLTYRQKTFKTPRKAGGTTDKDAKGAVTRDQFERGKITIVDNDTDDVPFNFEKKRKTTEKIPPTKDDDTPEKPKSKRGRPKKSVATTVETSPEPTPTKTTAKKRGRPPKKAKESSKEEEEKKDSEEEEEEVEDKKATAKSTKEEEKKTSPKKSAAAKKKDEKKGKSKKNEEEEKKEEEEDEEEEKKETTKSTKEEAKKSEGETKKKRKQSNISVLLKSFVDEAVEDAPKEPKYLENAWKEISTLFMQELQQIPSELDKPLAKKLKKSPPQQNPQNVELEQKRRALQSLLHKYSEEEKQWLALEKQYSSTPRKPAKAKKQVEEEEVGASDETKEFIEKSLKQITLKVDEVKPVIKEVKELTTRSEALLNEVSAKVHKEGFKDYENMNNAKALIKGIAFSET